MRRKVYLIIAIILCSLLRVNGAEADTLCGTLCNNRNLEVTYESLGEYNIGNDKFQCTKLRWLAKGKFFVVMIPNSASFKTGKLVSSKLYIQNDDYLENTVEEGPLPDVNCLFHKLLEPDVPFEMYIMHPESLDARKIYWLCEIGSASEAKKRQKGYKYAYKGDVIVLALPPQLIDTSFLKSCVY